MVAHEIDAVTGELAGDWCPEMQRARFRPGTEPTRACREHESPPLPPDEDGWLEEFGDRLTHALTRVLDF
jgi:hypothetical protein